MWARKTIPLRASLAFRAPDRVERSADLALRRPFARFSLTRPARAGRRARAPLTVGAMGQATRSGRGHRNDERASAGARARARGPVLGLDLAGSPHRPTGCCVLVGTDTVRSSVAFSDAEIRALVASTQPELLIVDAPLSLPRGRESIEDRSGPHLRACDRELLRRRIRFFPLTLGPMRLLTVRGMRLASEFRSAGVEVVEGYPGAAQDLLGIPRKGVGVAALRRGLRRLGLKGDLVRRTLTHDELDAATIAWVGRRYLAGQALVIGDPGEGLMVLPRPAGRLNGRAPAPPPGNAAGRPTARSRIEL